MIYMFNYGVYNVLYLSKYMYKVYKKNRKLHIILDNLSHFRILRLIGHLSADQVPYFFRNCIVIFLSACKGTHESKKK